MANDSVTLANIDKKSLKPRRVLLEPSLLL